MLGPEDPRQNHLLAALPEHERALIFPNPERVPMRLGDVLYETGIQTRHAQGRRKIAASRLDS
ncbi:MAG: hypothetical protein P4L70_01885 [Parasulfuritortus sp.]|jgi:hypothetical protein|nr:hypothetical protein [Parasulfuritortus sp.]